MCLKKDVSTLSGKPLKSVGQIAYLGSNISSNESCAPSKLSVIWKYDLSDKIKRDFFQVVALCQFYYMGAPYER